MVRARVASSWLQRGLLAVAVLWAPASLTQAALPGGVASGDVTQESAVLWARSTVVGMVTFEYSTDPTFTIKSTASAEVSEAEVPVKVEISGLEPAREYYYQVTDAESATAEGRFRTAAPPGTTAGLHFGASGDWQQAPPYPSLKNVPGSELDFFIKLGDGIYADQPGLPQARTLADFRTKHSEITAGRLGANFMAPLDASTCLLQTTDDHEIVDNYAGGATPGLSPDASPPLFTDAVTYVNQTQAYQDAMRAYREYHPVRSEVWNTPADDRMDGQMKLYRNVTYGSDAAVFVLDTRSFRDVQLPPVADPLDPAQVGAFLAASFDETRTLLGRAQMDALKADLLQSQQDGVTWKFVVVPEPIQNFGVVGAEDRFEGYAAERTELLSHIHQSGIQNVVFLAADHHGTSVNNLAYQELGPGGSIVSTPTDAFEVMTGPVAFYDGLLGPRLVEMAEALGAITAGQKALYNWLPVHPDPGDTVIPDDRDDFVELLINAQLDFQGLDPVGLEGSPIDAELLEGDYLAVHTFGWAEFEIDAITQDLLVTVWGVDMYSEADLQADPGAVIGLEPWVVSRFLVHPVPEPATLTLALLALAGAGLLLIRRRRK